MLDTLVERKRLDDLKMLIVDGRYAEQKNRLMECGLRHRWYLVENYSRAKACWAKGAHGRAFDMSTLDQAIATTSACGGFNIKHTENQKECVTFLTVMTRALAEKYAGKTLYGFARDDVLASGGAVRNGAFDRDCALFSLKEFNEAGRKNKRMTLREMFTGMLSLQFGITWASAMAITEVYPTLGSMMRALDRCDSTEEREEVLAAILKENTNKPLLRKDVRTVIALMCSEAELM